MPAQITTKGGGGNPLKEDATLRDLLRQLDEIDSQRDFRRWKVSFLERFEQYLEENSIDKAEGAYEAFTLALGKLSRVVKKCYTYLQKGDLGIERTTVMARKCLSDLHYQIEHVIEHLTGMLPATQSGEQRLGYSKFHLGAVLIRDGFVEYDRLVICDEILQHLRLRALQNVADRILLDQMEYYHDRLQMFCDVMADLGLYEAMVKCRQLLYMEDDAEEGENDTSSSSSSGNEDQPYEPPLSLSAIVNNEKEVPVQREINLATATIFPEATKEEPSLNMTATNISRNGKPKVAPSPIPAPTKESKKKKVNDSKPAPPPVTSLLYARKSQDDDDQSSNNSIDDHVSVNSHSSGQSKNSEVTETSYFNDKPVWEQQKGQNSQAYVHLGNYYHGNPNDWMIARKERNKDKGDELKSKPKREIEVVKETNKTKKGNKEIKQEQPVKKSFIDKAKRDKEKRDKEEKKRKKTVKNKQEETTESPQKNLQPLPRSYPPPKPSESMTKAAGSPHPDLSRSPSSPSPNNIPIAINILSQDYESDSDDDEKKTSYMPNIGGATRARNRTNDVEELGMESAHGLMRAASLSSSNQPKTNRPGYDQFGNPTTDDASVVSSVRKPRKGRKCLSDKEGDGNSQDEADGRYWDTVLGPTDRQGRPEMFRGMSVMSLVPDQKNSDDEGSVLPQNSILAPKLKSLIPMDDDEDNAEEDTYEKDDDPSVVPLTPSQIKAQQSPGTGYQRPSPIKASVPKKSGVTEEGSNQTSPTVLSTMDGDNDKSPRAVLSLVPGSAKESKSKEQDEEARTPKRNLLRRSDRHEQTKVPERTNTVPIVEISVPEESAPKPSEIRARNQPRFSMPTNNLASHTPRTIVDRPTSADETTAVPLKEISIETPDSCSSLGNLPTKAHDGQPQTFGRLRRTHSGLKDYSKKKDDEDDALHLLPRRTSSGLKDYSKDLASKTDKNEGRRPPHPTHAGLMDYSKRRERTIPLSNTTIGSENQPTKEKSRNLDSDAKSVSSDNMIRKPKKELKISMNTKEPEINIPVPIVEVPRSPKREKKERLIKNKETRDVPLNEEEKVLMRKKCYMWYARMGQPDRENMKRRVAALPPHCNIYVEDVDLLPWICHGTVLSVKAMNELFMGDDAE